MLRLQASTKRPTNPPTTVSEELSPHFFMTIAILGLFFLFFFFFFLVIYCSLLKSAREGGQCFISKLSKRCAERIGINHVFCFTLHTFSHITLTTWARYFNKHSAFFFFFFLMAFRLDSGAWFRHGVNGSGRRQQAACGHRSSLKSTCSSSPGRKNGSTSRRGPSVERV